MTIYPAIDLHQGKVVRLKRGDYQEETVYSKDPAAVAKEWERQGARWLHIVDLEGAKSGKVQNLKALKAIRDAVGCQIEFGGGLRTEADMSEILNLGINRVIVGTKALDDQFLKRILDQFGNRIALSLDVRDGQIQTEGWLKEGGRTLEEGIIRFNNFSLETLIYTDIQKDGMLAGPNFQGLERVLKLSRARVILSGGIGSLEDIKKAAQIHHSNFEGVIVGKALYENKFSVEQAMQLTKKGN